MNDILRRGDAYRHGAVRCHRFANSFCKKRLDGSQTTITRTRKKIDGLWRTVERVPTTGGADGETIFDSLMRPIKTLTFGPSPNGKTERIMPVIEYDRLSGEVTWQRIASFRDEVEGRENVRVYAERATRAIDVDHKQGIVFRFVGV